MMTLVENSSLLTFKTILGTVRRNFTRFAFKNKGFMIQFMHLIPFQDHVEEILRKWEAIDDEIWAKVIVLERNRRVAKVIVSK